MKKNIFLVFVLFIFCSCASIPVISYEKGKKTGKNTSAGEISSIEHQATYKNLGNNIMISFSEIIMRHKIISDVYEKVEVTKYGVYEPSDPMYFIADVAFSPITTLCLINGLETDPSVLYFGYTKKTNKKIVGQELYNAKKDGELKCETNVYGNKWIYIFINNEFWKKCLSNYSGSIRISYIDLVNEYLIGNQISISFKINDSMIDRKILINDNIMEKYLYQKYDIKQ